MEGNNIARAVLDVGCGRNPRGIVNIDLYVGETPHIKFTIDPKKIPNFVRCDAHNLPFKENSFKTVVSHHTLEHLTFPLKAIEEMYRVCKEKTFLRVPSEFNLYRSENHLYTWNPNTLKNLMLKSFPEVESGYMNSRMMLGGKLGRYIPFLNTILSKLGFYTEVYAIGKKLRVYESVDEVINNKFYKHSS